MVLTNHTVKEKLETALEKLWERSRFTSYFYQTIDPIEDTEIPTIALAMFRSRIVLYYAESFIRTVTIEEIIGLLVHEMLHVMMNHNHRAFPAEDIYLQNLAQDMVINSYIKNNRKTFFTRKGQYVENVALLLLPRGLPLIPVRFIKETDQTDPPWEDLYRWLRLLPSNELETIKQQFEGDDNALGIPFDDANPLSNLNDDRQSALNIPNEFLPDESFISVRDQKGLAFEDSKGGYLPTGVHMMMPRESFQHMKAKKEGLIQFSSIDSRCQEERAFQLVKGFISEVQARDTSPWAPKIKSLVDFSSQSSEWKYTHGRFNRRYFAQGIYASGRVFEEKGLITVAVDVSGSIIMMPDMLETVFGVVDDLTRKYTVQLVCVDEQLFIPEKTNDQWTQSTKADKPYIYSRGDWKYIKTGSMRTTFFSPLFNDYMKRHREMLLVITDGQIYDLEKLKPYYPTLWIIPEEFRQRFTEPFGQVVSIDSNNCAA